MRMDADEELTSDLVDEIKERVTIIRSKYKWYYFKKKSLFYGKMDKTWWRLSNNTS